MSKWIDKDLFKKFVDEKKSEKDEPTTYMRRSELAWATPERGTVDKAKVYVGRLLPDPKGQFYKKYYYHMFRTGEQWTFFLCPKTYSFENYCPWCSVTSKLYVGTKSDKDMASNYRRKEKFASNWFVIDDPRDAETANEEEKVEGKVKVYEFPRKVEVKIKEQITDEKNGLGHLIFEPGKDGFDFILKVTSTKKDAGGRVWPDYNLSEFSRKPHSIADTNKEIDKIMETTVDLDDYIADMERDEDEVVEALKQHMLWELVSSEWQKAKKLEKKIEEDDIPEFSVHDKMDSGKTGDFSGSEEEDDIPFEPEDDDREISDADFIEKLRNM